MLSFFFAGVLVYTILFVFRTSLILIFSTYYNERFNDNFEFDGKLFLAENLVFGTIFSLYYWVINDSSDAIYLNTLLTILFISLIPSYSYLISPFQYLLQKDKYKVDHTIERVLPENIGYQIRIIRGKVINAYATGIIPFSKTILIGKPLAESMSNDELKSIIYHEVGHLRLNHLNKLYFTSLTLSSLSYFLFLLRSQVALFNSSAPMEILSVGMTGAVMGLLFWYIPGKIQYRFELKADLYAATMNGKENLVNALKKLDTLSNGDVAKGGITHPKLQVRIENILKNTHEI